MSQNSTSPLILAITSQKGGVGKTTVAINLAYSLAKRGWRVLIADTDTQGSIGLSLSRRAKECKGLYDALRKDESPEKLVLSTRLAGLRVLTTGQCDFDLEESLDTDATKQKLGKLIRNLSSIDCDVIVIDTPAGVGPVTRSVLANSDRILVVEQAEPLGLRSLPLIIETLDRLRQRGARFQLSGIALNMVSHDREESLSAVRDLRELTPKGTVTQTIVPRDKAFLEASAKGIPVGMIGKNPPQAALVFDQLAAELEPSLNLTEADDAAQQLTQLMD
ncbi:ParA family protein [Sulfuriroseicoccus oceanibius]|uniref:ParA family protein n=1 Tax=Sulfuriroseicoccus oceanibius TaxID=2707525 RepID=A0A6B3LAD5_9BACT|nr:ParA family protein [Sulfuriroseicoccus oceanibius]QQL43991.1 ParA family protein [Sulfuriroseicoccus oceanibius]